MTYDFFLSYATLDDAPLIPDEPASKWVTTFQQVLTARLQQCLAREAKVFLDRRELGGNAALTEDIEKALDECHVFVAISSPTYYKRPWCGLERRRFIDRLGPNPVSARRVFIIHTTNVDLEIRPLTWQGEFFPDVRGYYFYRPGQDGHPRKLGYPSLAADKANVAFYYDEIDRLAREMADRIRALEESATPQAAAESPNGGATPVALAPSIVTPAAVAGPVVFLADNDLSVHGDHEELRSAMGAAGFEVRSGIELEGKTPEEWVLLATKALGFVQIVGPTLLPGADGVSRDELQLAAARAAGLGIFRWRPPDLDVEAAALKYPGYREFALAQDVRRQLLPSFKEDLMKELKDLQVRQKLQSAAPEDERLVLIAGTEADIDAHLETVTTQLQQHKLGHLITDAPEAELQAGDVRGFLVLYGGTKAEWVRDRLTLVRRLPKTRQKDLKVGVYFCAPPPEFAVRRLLFNLESIKKIRWNEEEKLREFAQAVAS